MMHFSYSKGPGTELLDLTIGEQLAHTAQRWPDQLAVVSCHQGVRLTWSQVLDAADRISHGLTKLGIGPADRVGVWAMNCWEWVVMTMACARAGVVLVTVNPASRAHELAYILKCSRMKAIFLNASDSRTDYLSVLGEARAQGDFALRNVICFGSDAWDALAAESPTAYEGALSPQDVSNIQYTSGTTGSPKGVLLTHHNLVNNGLLATRILRYTPQDRICVAVPLSHIFGSSIGMMAALTSGCAVILPNASFDARKTLEAIETERATSIYGVPTMFIAELRHPDFGQFDLTSLRTGVMAGAPCPVEVMKLVVSDMHCPEMVIAYGMTESSPIITMSDLDDDLDHRVATVGKALPCTEVQVVDVESGEVVPRGVQGEICTRGYLVMKGYDADPEATARAVDTDGWLHTGDLGLMREDGYVKVTGRAKDMIIRGGENIYPREIEEFLYTYPRVAEVQIVGIPDEKYGEIVAAWIRLKPGESATAEELQDYCKGQIAHFKIPEKIRFVESFPTTVSGKIQKYRMREIEIRDLGLEQVTRTETA